MREELYLAKKIPKNHASWRKIILGEILVQFGKWYISFFFGNIFKSRGKQLKVLIGSQIAQKRKQISPNWEISWFFHKWCFKKRKYRTQKKYGQDGIRNRILAVSERTWPSSLSNTPRGTCLFSYRWTIGSSRAIAKGELSRIWKKGEIPRLRLKIVLITRIQTGIQKERCRNSLLPISLRTRWSLSAWWLCKSQFWRRTPLKNF